MPHLPVPIPTNQAFLKQWHAWISSKVSKRFKRDKERVADAAQNVRVRLLSKDFTGRWFFKHLTDELVDLSQAQRMLGGSSIVFIGSILPVDVGLHPACGNKPCKRAKRCVRSCQHSLWRVKDLLEYAKFDFPRYYYSIQGHTIESEAVLKLLGYPPGSYGILGSLYRQGRLKPAELTEHACIEVRENPRPRSEVCWYTYPNGKRCDRRHFSRGYCSSHYGQHIVVPCPACVHGRELLKKRGVSLAAHWSDESMTDKIAKLRWNDFQLKPFLREWHRSNLLRATPSYVMRQPGRDGKPPGIDAGLLKYAEMVIDHEVVNDFKRYSRGDDMSTHVFNNGMSPELGDDETTAWEADDASDDPSRRIRVFRDAGSGNRFAQAEARKDLSVIIQAAGLTEEEADAIFYMNLREMSAKEYADSVSRSVQRVNRIHASAMAKLREHRDALTAIQPEPDSDSDAQDEDSPPALGKDPSRT